MTINLQRLLKNIDELAAITDEQRPFTRRAFTKIYLEGREWLKSKLADINISPYLDVHGNLLGQYKGKSPNALMIGSHTDTVPSGGKYDGILGVLSGLEVLYTLYDNNIVPDNSIVLADFLSEEVSEYGLSCVGSRSLCGFVTDEHLEYRNGEQETLKAAMKRMGATPDERHLAEIKDVQAYFELHIEQGNVLESSATNIGIVSAIAGLTKVKITFEGQANHAGTTPMHLRKDAALAAAKLTWSLNEAVRQLIAKTGDYIVATVGKLDIEPNAANIIPSKAEMIVDIRSENWHSQSRMVKTLENLATDIANGYEVALAQFKILSSSKPVKMDERLQKMASAACTTLGKNYKVMVSGAGHDAVFLGQKVPSAMLFVPSVGGISHNPKEFTKSSDIENGANVLLQTVLNFKYPWPELENG